MENLENNESANIIEQLERIRTATILATKAVYNTAEASEYMGIKKTFLYELVRAHKINHFRSKGGKLLYFKHKDLDDWMLYNSVPACYAAATPARVRAKSFAY